MAETVYTSLRGKRTATRPIRDLTLNERRQVLLELETDKSAVVRQRHNISNQTLGHIRWHHGRDHANKREYSLNLIKGVQSPMKARAVDLKRAGKNSAQVAEILGISLDRVNSFWAKLKL